MNDLSNNSDEALLGIFMENNIAGFRGIYEKYWYRLYCFANKRVRCKEASEEIVQNLFTRFWVNRGQLNIKSSLEAYLFTAARYSIIDYMEKEATRSNYHKLAYYSVEKVDNSADETVLLHDLESKVENEAVKLPQKRRSVFILSRRENKTNKEIAQELGISEKTVENHITNALKVIRLSLKDDLSFILLLSLHFFFRG